MTTHICRDFLSDGSSDLEVYEAALYYNAIFLRSVMGFSVVGQTTMNIGSTYLIDEGDSLSINLGSNLERAVSIPSAQHIVTVSDIGRILVLKSTSYPSYNSGLFRITSVDVSNNYLYIDYRSATDPPAESSAIDWAIYETELSVTFSVTDNGDGDGTYETQGAASASRIILQSPTNSWQVRFCLEGSTDQGNFDVRMSIAVGTGGNSSGDFSAATNNTHFAQFYDRTSGDYANLIPGIGQVNDWRRGGWRFYAWGSEDPDNIFFIMRNAGGGSRENWCSYGMTEFEDQPVQTNIVHRTFVLGSSTNADTMSWSSSFGQSVATDGGRCGAAFGLSNRPVSAVASTYCRLAGQQRYTNNIRYSTFSADSSMTKQTDLLLVDVVAGTWDAMDFSGQDRVTVTEARRIGTLPFARMGRTNFGDWSLAVNTNGSWFHARHGVYLPWNGPLILP